MKKYFVLSDTHSFYNEMMVALLSNKFDIDNKDHIIIHCGDMLDRGPDAKKTVDFFYKLLQEKRCILIKGNHEDLFEMMVKKHEYHSYDVSNGTLSTLMQLSGFKDSAQVRFVFNEALNKYDPHWDELLNSMINYFETEKYIFTHGWIPCGKKFAENSSACIGHLYDPEWRNASEEEFYSARWLNGMAMAADGVVEPNKTIICGHYHTSYGNLRKEFPNKSNMFYIANEFKKGNKYFLPYYNDGIIAIDAATALTGFCNCLVFNENEL